MPLFIGDCDAERTDRYMENNPNDPLSILSSDLNPTPVSFLTVGSLSVSGTKYFGSVLAPNGKVYFIPANETRVMAINPNTHQIEIFGDLAGSTKWAGGVLAPNGKIYAHPYSANQILEIDPETNTTDITRTVTNGEKYRYGGIVTEDGKLYSCPYGVQNILEYNLDAKTKRTFGSFQYTTANKFYSAALHPNGHMYAMPFDAFRILDVDTVNGTMAELLSNITATSKWGGTVLGTDGKIYGIPFQSTQIIEYDPILNTIQYHGSLSTGSKWAGGVMAPNGKIYGIPYGSSDILEFDITTKHINLIPTGISGSAKWFGGTLAPNGKIYCAPHTNASILVIDTKNVPSNPAVCLSRYFNKL